MIGPMRNGLPVGGAIIERLTYIDENITIWRTGWLLWMTSALSLFMFATFMSTYIENSAFRTFGLGLIALGIAPDLIAEVIYAFILPIGFNSSFTVETLILFEQTAIHLTGFLGNGLYNLGGLILTVLLIQQNQISKPVAVIGGVAWCLGIGLSVSILVQSMSWSEILTALSMSLSTFWMLLIAHTLFKYDHI